MAQWQQAKRQGKDPRAIETAVQDAWNISDSKVAFIHALEERGFKLARGDQRGFVVIDHQLEIYSLSKWSGQKPKALEQRLGAPADLLDVTQTQALMSNEIQSMLSRLQKDVETRVQAKTDRFEARRLALVKKQQDERTALKAAQEQRRNHTAKISQARFRGGAGGIWDRLRGEHGRIQKQNELKAYQAFRQDRQDMDALIFSHLKQRRQIEIFKLRLSDRAERIQHGLERDRQGYTEHIGRKIDIALEI